MTKYNLLKDKKRVDMSAAGVALIATGQKLIDKGNQLIMLASLNGVQKFNKAAKSFKSSDQMQTLIKTHFFTKAELRDGLKRWIHLNYIEIK